MVKHCQLYVPRSCDNSDLIIRIVFMTTHSVYIQKYDWMEWEIYDWVCEAVDLTVSPWSHSRHSGTWQSAYNYEGCSISHHMMAICSLPCRLPLSKANGKIRGRSQVAPTSALSLHSICLQNMPFSSLQAHTYTHSPGALTHPPACLPRTPTSTHNMIV